MNKILYKGEPTKGLKFYDLLMESTEFTSELGKVTLASGRLEAELISLLTHNNVNGEFQKSTLGVLVKTAHEYNLLTNNEVSAFRMITKHRNYLTHSIYALLNYQIDETILERENLLDSDVDTYIDIAWVLNSNLQELREIVKKRNSARNKLRPRS